MRTIIGLEITIFKKALAIQGGDGTDLLDGFTGNFAALGIGLFVTVFIAFGNTRIIGSGSNDEGNKAENNKCESP
jgi:hypothetical protein